MNAHTPGCRDCTIDYGHGHDGDQIDFCPLHAAARPTLEALEAIMRLIPADIADTVAGYRARAAIRAAKGDS